ncbi:thioredoxin-like protein [Tricladium varicosporioides]|nr:thioredoxin-like protein [Hymenoscyphus varicosporioides]
MYESTVIFIFDTICPWTYLAKKRLDEALRRVRETDAAGKVNFTIKFSPYQLYPEASQEGEDKYEWYKKSKYGDSEEKMKMYMTLMSAYGASAGIDYKYTGIVANSLPAHRIIQYFQESLGPVTADKLVMSFYSLYFEQSQHPSSSSTLLTACLAAGIPQEKAEKVINDESEGLMEAKLAIRENVGNGIDSVPVVVVEGKRKDVTITGANEVEDYEKALRQVIKESS